MIEDTCEQFDTAVKVITDFSERNLKGRDAIELFVNEYCDEYQTEFGLDAVEEPTKSNLTRIILYTILRKRHDINKIKQSVNL